MAGVASTCHCLPAELKKTSLGRITQNAFVAVGGALLNDFV